MQTETAGLQRTATSFIFLTVFVDMLGYGMIVPLLPFLAERFGATALTIGSLSSLYALMQLIAAPILGSLSDHYGRRPVLIYCLFGAAAAYLLLGLAGSLPLIALAMLVGGLASASMTTAQAYVADTTTAEQRTRGLGLVGAAFGLGLMLGPASGGLLSSYGLGVPAFIAALLATGNGLFGLLALPESLPPERRKSNREAPLNPFWSLRAMLNLPAIRGLMLTIFLLNLAFAGLQSNFPLFSKTRFGWDAVQNGLFFAFVGVCAVLTQGLLLARLQPRFGERRLVLGGLALMALNLLLVALAPAGWWLFPTVGLLALGSGLAIPSLTSLVSQRVAAHEQGTAMGGMQAMLSMTLIVGPSLAGLTFDAAGPPAPYLLGSLLCAAAMLVALRR